MHMARILDTGHHLMHNAHTVADTAVGMILNADVCSVVTLQWQAGHHLLPTVRVPSDPTISATTGVPAGQYGQSFHRSRGHNNTTIAQLQHNSMARQQQQHGAGTARTPSAGHLAIAGGLRHNSS